MNKKILFFTATLLLSPISLITYGNQDIESIYAEIQQESIQQVILNVFMLSINQEEAEKFSAATNPSTTTVKSYFDIALNSPEIKSISLPREVDIHAAVEELEVLNIVDTISKSHLVTLNKFKSSLSTNDVRRVDTSENNETPTFAYKSTNSSIELSPVINEDETIALTINMSLERFNNPPKEKIVQRKIETTIHTADKECVLLKVTLNDEETNYKEDILILISSSIISKKTSN